MFLVLTFIWSVSCSPSPPTILRGSYSCMVLNASWGPHRRFAQRRRSCQRMQRQRWDWCSELCWYLSQKCESLNRECQEPDWQPGVTETFGSESGPLGFGIWTFGGELVAPEPFWCAGPVPFLPRRESEEPNHLCRYELKLQPAEPERHEIRTTGFNPLTLGRTFWLDLVEEDSGEANAKLCWDAGDASFSPAVLPDRRNSNSCSFSSFFKLQISF